MYHRASDSDIFRSGQYNDGLEVHEGNTGRHARQISSCIAMVVIGHSHSIEAIQDLWCRCRLVAWCYLALTHASTHAVPRPFRETLPNQESSHHSNRATPIRTHCKDLESQMLLSLFTSFRIVIGEE